MLHVIVNTERIHVDRAMCSAFFFVHSIETIDMRILERPNKYSSKNEITVRHRFDKHHVSNECQKLNSLSLPPYMCVCLFLTLHLADVVYSTLSNDKNKMCELYLNCVCVQWFQHIDVIQSFSRPIFDCIAAIPVFMPQI